MLKERDLLNLIQMQLNIDPFSMKYNAKGDQVAYLKGDILKVPAHFASPGSYLYIKAEADVPRGLTLGDLFA